MTDDIKDIVVVGSGPSGIAVTKALLAQGETVTMIDAGGRMPDDAAKLRARLAAARPDQWDRAAVAKYNSTSLRERGGVPLKTVFGSDYPYHFNPDLKTRNASILGSHARGGLSNAWGASILPLCDDDVRDWPLQRVDFDPHFRAVLKWLPHAQGNDELADQYPLHSDYVRHLALSSQGRRLMKALRAGRHTLQDMGIRFGQARLAVSNCFYCRQCLHGCPYDFIYNSSQTLEDLRYEERFSYIGDTQLKALQESNGEVKLATSSGELRTRRVFLATGVLNSTMLMMDATDLQRVIIRDSAYGLLPFLQYQPAKGVESESLYTLPQVFMEMRLPELTQRNIHLQWYSYNDFYRQEMRKTLGKLFSVLPSFVPRLIIDRMWSVQTFLHSDDSPELRLKKLTADNYELSAADEPDAGKLLLAAYKRLGTLGGMLGGKPLPLLRRLGIAGGGFHSGASFPMTEKPAHATQSDLAGRPHGFKRVHIVDSSVLPNIASSTITLTVMANAHRIGSEYQRYI